MASFCIASRYSASETRTARPRLPLSNLDSNTNVVSSSFRGT